jgi:transcriptional repressor NrdR
MKRTRSYLWPTMLCPFCSFPEDKVVDSRSAREGRAIRRRRECLSCGKRFTTYEYIESLELQVVKRDGRREPFDREKIIKGVTVACKKRPIGVKQIEAVADKVESLLQQLGSHEVQTSLIGELVVKELQTIDEVAFVRFASVYRQFQDSMEFLAEIRNSTIPPP